MKQYRGKYEKRIGTRKREMNIALFRYFQDRVLAMDKRRKSAKNYKRSGCFGNWPEYRVWGGMLQRCNNPKNTGYKDYGGRGIKVCAEWHSFERFILDMGLRPSNKHQLDRVNNNKGYYPHNCRWVLPPENARNKGDTKLTAANVTDIRKLFKTGKYTRKQLAQKYGVHPNYIGSILRKVRWASIYGSDGKYQPVDRTPKTKRRVLKESEKKQIARLYNKGMTVKELSNKYSLSVRTIYKVLDLRTGRNWMTMDIAREMRELRKHGLSVTEIANKYGKRSGTVSKIIKHQRWKENTTEP